MNKNTIKAMFLACVIFFVVLSMYAFEPLNQGVLKAEEEKEDNISTPVSLLSEEHLKLPDEMVLPDGQRLPLNIPSLGPRALNGTKINTPTTIVNPVVFIEFADDTGEWVTAENLAKMQSNYNTGANSLNAYYKKISYGNLNVISEFYPKKAVGDQLFFDSITPFKSTYKRGYILPKSASNTIGYDPAIPESTTNPNSYRYHELKVLEEVLSTQSFWSNILTVTDNKKQILNTKFTSTFSYNWTFPQATTIKQWEDLSLDSITFVLRGSMYADMTNQILWPHKFTYRNCNTGECDFNQGRLPTSLVNGNAVFEYVSNYAVVTADNNIDLFSDEPDLGVVTHEFLHQFNAPDLYRLTDKGMAVGKWDLMGWQQKVPQYLLQYTNSMFGIWKTPDFKVVNSSIEKSERLDMRVALAQYNQADYILPTAYKIVPKDTSKHEYFMVESRKKTASGFDSSLDDSGLIVYRIHENIPSTIGGAFCGITCGNMGTNLNEVGYAADEVFVYRPNAQSASLASANRVDEELGNAALPRTLDGTKVNAIGKSLSEVPANAPFDNETLYFSDGTNSGVRIEQISDPDVENGGITFSVLYDDEVYAVDTENPSVDRTSLSSVALGSTWVKADQEVSVNIADNVGIKEVIIFTTDGLMRDEDGNETGNLNVLYEGETLITSDTLKFRVLRNGTYSLFVSDASGNTSDTVEFEISKVDHTAPNLVFNVSGSERAKTLGFTSDDVTDGSVLSGIKANSLKYVYIAPNESEENLTYDQTYQGTPLALKENFYKKVCAKVEDNAGNVSKKCQVIGNADITPPSVGNITYNPAGWSHGDIVMSVPVSDNQGIKSIRVSTTSGKLVKNSVEVTEDTRELSGNDMAASEDFILRKNATYTIVVTDTSGNTSKDGSGQDITISKIDVEKPILDTFTYSINASNKVEFEATSSDKPVLAGSGVKEMQYQYQDDPDAPLSETWQIFNSPMEILKDANYAGKFCLRSEDNAGNFSEVSCKSFKNSDQSNPVLETSIDNLVDITKDSTGWTNSSSLSLTLHASDVDSGIKSIEVTLKGVVVGTKYETVQAVNSHDYELTVLENGTYDVHIIDQQDNEVRASFVVNQFDREKPVIDETSSSKVSLFLIFPTNDLDLGFTNHDMPITYHSGVKEIYYQLVANGGSKPESDVTHASWTNINPSEKIRIHSGYDGTLYAYALDHAGNQSTLYEEVIKNEEPSFSSDASLSSLTLSSGNLSPSFSANTTMYSASVANRISSITITAVANDANASLSGDGNKSLSLAVKENMFSVSVTAEDGTIKSYTIRIIRAEPSQVESSDATLSSLTISNGVLSPSFDPLEQSYQAHVEADVESITISATPCDEEATLSGDANKEVTLLEGENTFHIVVSDKQSTSKTYTVVITRAAKKLDDVKEIKSADQNVSVRGNFDETFALVSEVKQIDEIAITDEFKKEYMLQDVFDIYITKNGTRYTVEEEVTVRIQLKDELKGRKDMLAAYIKEDGGYVILPTTIYDDYVEFTTDHFSMYALISLNAQNQIRDVQTGDTSETQSLLYTLLGGCAVFYLYCKKKRKVKK